MDRLIFDAQNGDESAKNSVAKHFRDLLFRMARNYKLDYEDSKDIAQEACLKAIKALDTYEVGTNLRAWLLTIFLNCLSDLFRGKIITDIPNPVYSQMIIDVIYLITPSLQERINETIPEVEREELFNKITNDLVKNTFYKFMKLKYQNYRHNMVLNEVKRWLYEFFGVKVIPFSDLTSDDGNRGFFIENVPDPSPQNDPEDNVLERELYEKINEYINKLPSDLQKLVIRFHYLEEIKVKEVAQILEKAPNAVSQLLNEARKNLKNMMSNDDYFKTWTSR